MAALTLNSWVDIPPGNHFPLNNIPFGVFQKTGQDPHCATRIGDFVVDLFVLQREGIFNSSGNLNNGQCFRASTLNEFMSLGRPAWIEARQLLQSLLVENGDDRLQTSLRAEALVPISDVQMCLPARIGDYTDFYSSITHATNLGTMFRGPENALKENWLHLPVGYHGRASSVVTSGTPIRRPKGQIRPNNQSGPIDANCNRLDYEVEMAFFVGPGNQMGERIPVENAHDHIFGLVLMNDWSARDIQKWEYVPLGPFNGKNFATTISPWIITMEALEPFKCEPHDQSQKLGHPPLPYLQDPNLHGYDVNLNVSLQPKGGAAEVIGTTSSRNLYWTFEQQLAHHTSTGCPFNSGDLCGSGTISGTDRGSFGSLIENSSNGKRTFDLQTGTSRTFLLDHDNVIMTGYCENETLFLGFGECSGIVLPANQ